uniref:Uncharacterized protein n=1 Tax=Chromera velia CCMP2878 TaxID=1169474 RepID=A0A0G4G4D9_9ALVE|eukprot:Cvel_20093.t1-p1 / transcript=Cvel_20093.t1 / gene=Cvel_20093 / organism=Chromera_velia_CCMP2878 / gene_product=hypothetical protein / transcript_product=hypothetical protein / location=Cvel_scaffold1779:10734-13073(+) / protein_length=647 / sequence_SO=supercontig / SO=protein_coding / is_pseudo=false
MMGSVLCFATFALLLSIVSDGTILCVSKGCIGDIAAIGTPDDWKYEPSDPKKNQIDLEGKHVLVIGDSRGMGRAVVLEFCRRVGASGRVLGGSRTRTESLDADLLAAGPCTYRHFVFDASNTTTFDYFKDDSQFRTQVVRPHAESADYARLRDEVGTFLLGRVDVVFKVAGVYVSGHMADIPWPEFDAARRAHLADHAIWDVVKHAMKEREDVVWVTAGSIDARIRIDSPAAGYTAAKTYQATWVDTMHYMTRQHPLYHKIKFLTVEPGPVNTTFAFEQNAIMPSLSDVACPLVVGRGPAWGLFLLNTPIFRTIQPDEVAQVILEAVVRRDVGKPFPDAQGNTIPNRITVWGPKKLYDPILGGGTLFFDGLLLDVDWAFRNVPSATLVDLPGNFFLGGKFVFQCDRQRMDDWADQYVGQNRSVPLEGKEELQTLTTVVFQSFVQIGLRGLWQYLSTHSILPPSLVQKIRENWTPLLGAEDPKDPDSVPESQEKVDSTFDVIGAGLYGLNEALNKVPFVMPSEKFTAPLFAPLSPLRSPKLNPTGFGIFDENERFEVQSLFPERVKRKPSSLKVECGDGEGNDACVKETEGDGKTSKLGMRGSEGAAGSTGANLGDGANLDALQGLAENLNSMLKAADDDHTNSHDAG